MGLTDDYLKKAAWRDPLVQEDPHPGLQLIVTIPAYNEPGLQNCLESLLRCGTRPDIRSEPVSAGAPLPPRTEVLILFNAPADDSPGILHRNIQTCRDTEDWIGAHPHPRIRFHALLDHTFPPGEAGVGLARKILMDEAVRRFERAGRILEGKQACRSGIIASLDADTVVDPNYMHALMDHFRQTRTEGCSVYFEHPLSPEEDPFYRHTGLLPEKKDPYSPASDPRVYEAVASYELHLRYYVNAVRSTGYPFAFHTVGSAFAVRADIYAMEGGMNRRQGGEDFYFIQKVALRGNFSACNATRVVPSPRPSDRVPFGTGPAVQKMLYYGSSEGSSSESPGGRASDAGSLNTYDPRPFRMLREFFSQIHTAADPARMDPARMDPARMDPGRMDPARMDLSEFYGQNPLLGEFLRKQHFEQALEEIHRNSASSAAFLKRFRRWFNMFRIMKFLHFARDRGYPDVPVKEAAAHLLIDIEKRRGHSLFLEKGILSVAELLQIYRQMDRGSIPPLP